MELGVARDLDTSDFHAEVIDLLGNRVEAEIGVAFFVASYSALRKSPVSPALLVLGDMSVQGNIKPLRSLTEPLQVCEGQRRKARADSDREQAQLPGCERRHSGTCRSGLLRRSQEAALKVLGAI